MALTSELIEVFSRSFGRPVNKELTTLTVTERELLGNILLEEVVEYCVKGLGLKIYCNSYDETVDREHGNLKCVLDEGQQVDPIECADGLADVNVVIHFNAHWQGIPLDRATEIVNDSNMSKLGPNGEPIINGVSVGYCAPNSLTEAGVGADPGYDPTKPIGKILKGLNYWEPRAKLAALIGVKLS